MGGETRRAKSLRIGVHHATRSYGDQCKEDAPSDRRRAAAAVAAEVSALGERIPVDGRLRQPSKRAQRRQRVERSQRVTAEEHALQVRGQTRRLRAPAAAAAVVVAETRDDVPAQIQLRESL